MQSHVIVTISMIDEILLSLDTNQFVLVIILVYGDAKFKKWKVFSIIVYK